MRIRGLFFVGLMLLATAPFPAGRSLLPSTLAAHLGLRGPVKRVRQEQAPATLRFGNEEESGRKVVSVYRFRRDGRLVSHSQSFSDGTPLVSEVFHYNSYQRLVQRSLFRNGSRPQRIMRYRYDRFGRLQRVRHLSGSHRLELQEDFVYNQLGLAAEKRSYAADGTQTLLTTYHYDRLRRLTNQRAVGADGTLQRRLVFSYSDAGHHEELYERGPSGTLQLRTLRHYNLAGQMIRLDQTQQGNTGRVVLEYNRRQRLVRRLEYDTNSRVQATWSYRYREDRHGNWIKRSEYQHQTRFGKKFLQPVSVTYRSITYHY